MADVTRSFRVAYERSEEHLGRSWPVWALALLLYTVAGYVLLTQVRLPSTLHLIVYVMAAGILVTTLVSIEFAVAGLAMMIPFARPGFTIPVFGGVPFHISGMNLAVAGVWLVFLFRHMTDAEVASKGPLLRRTPLDYLFVLFLALATIATLHGLNINAGAPIYQRSNLLYLKEQVMYILWFYLIVTVVRTPVDARRFAVFFAMSGIFVSMIGLQARISGVIGQAGPVVSEAEAEFGVAGGRTGGVGAGGWFGLGHPNLYAAFLLMTLPLWYFGVEHLKRGFLRLAVNLGVLLGFVALLYTYARSGWVGMMSGLAVLGLRDPRFLRKLVLSLIGFVVIAQMMTLSLVGYGVLEVIQMRFEQLERSRFSARPDIYAGALNLVMKHPLIGVGLGAFRNHAYTSQLGFRVAHAHNVVLTYACELGVPAAVVYASILGMVVALAWKNLRARASPGYGFLAQGGFAGIVAVLVLMQFDHIFFDRSVGFALYGLFGLIVAFHRMIREGAVPGVPGYKERPPELEAVARPSRLWIEP